ncbi:MAG: helix-turn-helix transcriptional regulator [Acidimicrobiales bacterium]|nr:helix-turn-helix transcriptional regulator [Acidimicrobiales bacterium]
MARTHGDGSPLAEALARLGDRWTLQVIEALLAGPRRFTELLDGLPGLAPSILTQRLRALERDGVVVARPYQERPPRFSYQLTTAGHDLAGALRLLAHWGANRVGGVVEPPRHAPCGTPLEVRWYCPACGRVVDDADQGDVHHV